MANALFEFFISTLPVSRLQRHLSDSTIIRNFGSAFSHVLISLLAIQKGIGKVQVNAAKLTQDLENHWGVIAEAYQTVLRQAGLVGGYDLLKEVTRGKSVSREDMLGFIAKVSQEHNPPLDVVEKLSQLTPHSYLGCRQID